MTLKPVDAERLLRARLGEPAKEPTKYVIGFRTRTGKVFAFHRETTETLIWFQPPTPPALDGVTLLSDANNGNSNLNGVLAPLSRVGTIRAQIDSPTALQRFVDWYGGGAVAVEAAESPLHNVDFRTVFARFQELVNLRSGHRFETFQDGLAAAWESYKPHLRDLALKRLAAESWDEASIGSGEILRHVIDAIEIQKDGRSNLTNNLVFWQNRFGHANREHRILIEALEVPCQRQELERLLFDFYQKDADPSVVFEKLADAGGKYTLIAYLFFLRDMDRFMPIQPTGFDRAFRLMGIDFATLRQVSWENYSVYLAILNGLRSMIATEAKLPAVHLVDAHSFVWLLAFLSKMEASGELTAPSRKGTDGRVLGGREKSIIAMRLSVENTVRNSNGQTVQRVVKNKELRMTTSALETELDRLLTLQDNRCALTGIPFEFHGTSEDKNLLPSLDRKDSNGHYEVGNLQVVCQFINFWKSDGDNDEFARLLMIVRGHDSSQMEETATQS